MLVNNENFSNTDVGALVMCINPNNNGSGGCNWALRDLVLVGMDILGLVSTGM